MNIKTYVNKYYAKIIKKELYVIQVLTKNNLIDKDITNCRLNLMK